MSEYLDTLGLVKSYSFKFLRQKNKKKSRIKHVLVLRRSRGSGDLPVCRIAC
jgi:hypothetical protein